MALPTNTFISGAGIAGCPANCPKIASGSGSPATTYTLNFTGSAAAASSEAMKAGKWAPMTPLQSATVKGYIDSPGGVPTLHVTSMDDGTTHSGFASFTATYNGAGTLTTSSSIGDDRGGHAGQRQWR